MTVGSLDLSYDKKKNVLTQAEQIEKINKKISLIMNSSACNKSIFSFLSLRLIMWFNSQLKNHRWHVDHNSLQSHDTNNVSHTKKRRSKFLLDDYYR